MSSDFFSQPYNPSQSEEKLRQFWNNNKFYNSSPNLEKKPFTIAIPPPNVTGSLHLGHMLNNTLQDILIRWNRAMGLEACWIPGTDHASIATEAKVTKKLLDSGISKKEIGREEFLKHAWDWKNEYGKLIVNQLKALGISCDWSREAFTLSPEYSKSVIKAFVKLYQDGLVYKGNKLVNWCPISQSVISDEEVLNEERQGSLWHLKYFLVDENNQASTEYLSVATTRPETLFGDLAVAVNPSDERYKHLKGKKVLIPVCNKIIPIIFDNYVEKEFGTGVVKITPAHDMNDFEVGARHNLGLLNIMNPNASLNENVHKDYIGLDRFDARKKLIKECEQKNLLEKIEPHKLVIGISERGNVPIEYYLSPQWYIKMESLAKLALNATRSKKLKLIPAHTEKVWEHWLTNIKDWCVSRQLWWGHRIPIYSCKNCGHVHCAENMPAACEHCNHNILEQDPDVLDTWASAWLWPFAVHGWPEDANASMEVKNNLDFYYPTDIVVTGSDIIFFWIARMVMAGEYFTQKIPFKEVLFTPIVRDDKGRKMSKSLGNSPDIYEIISQYGTDALRFSLINQMVIGQDIQWKNESCTIGRTFANKLWNAARFLTLNLEKNIGTTELNYGKLYNNECNFEKLEEAHKKIKHDSVCNWLMSEFFTLVESTHKSVEQRNFSNYSAALYEFTWMRFCDWFVELIKPRFLNETTQNSEEKEFALNTLKFALCVYDGVLRLLQPLMPYLTEEIWLHLSEEEGKTLGQKPLPKTNHLFINAKANQAMSLIQNIVGGVRTIRGQFSIHPAIQLTAVLQKPESEFENLQLQLEYLSKAKFEFLKPKPAFSALSLVQGCELYIDLSGHTTIAKEKDRLQKRIEKLNQNIAGTEKKLLNSEFVKGAPEHIINGAKLQLEENKKELSLLKESLNVLLLQN
jgi:valyl-tRNA synthetase